MYIITKPTGKPQAAPCSLQDATESYEQDQTTDQNASVVEMESFLQQMLRQKCLDRPQVYSIVEGIRERMQMNKNDAYFDVQPSEQMDHLVRLINHPQEHGLSPTKLKIRYCDVNRLQANWNGSPSRNAHEVAFGLPYEHVTTHREAQEFKEIYQSLSHTMQFLYYKPQSN